MRKRQYKFASQNIDAVAKVHIWSWQKESAIQNIVFIHNFCLTGFEIKKKNKNGVFHLSSFLIYIQMITKVISQHSFLNEVFIFK